MEESDKNKTSQISRRGFLPILGGGLMLPLLGFGKTAPQPVAETEEYQTLLKADGTAVRVKKSVVANAKVFEKNISNQSLFGWLKNK